MTETGLNTMMGEAAKSIQESGGKHVGVFEAKIIMAGRVLIVLTLIAVGSLLVYQVPDAPTPTFTRAPLYFFLVLPLLFFSARSSRSSLSDTRARCSSLSLSFATTHTHTHTGRLP